MALRAAIATGNWSNPATWNGGVLPNPGDVVASNNFTVTIDQNINVDSITNIAQSIVGMVPNMTSNTLPSGIVDQSSFLVGFEGWKAFGSGEWRFNLDGWVSYEFTSPKAVNQYYFQGDTSKSAWNFEAWNGSNWIVLHSVTGASTGVYTSPLIGNSTSYIKYRLFFFHTTNSNRVDTVQFYEYLGTTAAVAGGGFVLNSGVTVTCTNTDYGLLPSSSSVVLLTYSGSGIATVNASIAISPNNNASFPTLLFTGSGTLNINGTIKGYSSQSHSGSNMRNLILNGSGTVNIIGNIEVSYVHDSTIITTSNNVTVNHTGDIFTTFVGGNNGSALSLGLSTWTTTGTITGINRSSVCQITVGSTGRFFHIGTILAGPSGAGVINNLGFAQLTSIMDVGSTSQVCLLSTSTTAINLCTGPFICSNYGFFPYQVNRMHLIPTTSSYIEFRDETTNGAVSPGATAPATRMIAPAGVSDSPIPANVRFGITYANGSLAGTLRIPNANSVAFGVEVDNTIGNAVITPQSVWDFAVANLTTMGSIGERLKKTSTVDSTGAQLSSFEF